MRVFVLFFFVTLVLNRTLVQAAPAASHAPVEDPMQQAPEVPPPSLNPAARESLDWQTPPPIGAKEQAAARSESLSHPVYNWSVRAHLFAGSISETDTSAQLPLYGIRGDFLKDSAGSWQGEFATRGSELIHLTVAKKRYFLLEKVTLPYYRFGVGEMIESVDGIGSIVDFKRTQALAAVGLDDLFLLNQRLQGEIEVGLAAVGPQIDFSLGVAF